jgi:hypothetical protein
VINPRSTWRGSKAGSAMALIGAVLAWLCATQPAAAAAGHAPAAPPHESNPPYGWYPTNAGDPRYEKYGPRELTNLNRTPFCGRHEAR